jgi:TonB family protein
MRTIIYIFLLLICTSHCGFAQDAEKTHENSSTNEQINNQGRAKPLNMDSVLEKISYPPDCLENKFGGQVMIMTQINKNGVPVKHVIKSSPHQSISQAVLKVIYDLRFRPALHKGEPVVCWVTIPFYFDVDKGEVRNIFKK